MLSFMFNLFLLLINRIDGLTSSRCRIKSSLVIVIANCLFFTTSTEASTYRFDFSATDFTSFYYGLPAPQDVVAGSITFSADALGGAPIDSIVSASLSIAGHSYTIDEIGWSTESGSSSYHFGGTLNSINSIDYGTDDFSMYLNNNNTTLRMTYSSFGVFDGWSTTNLNGTFSPVPIPSSLLLLGAGLAGLLGGRLRMKK